MPNGTVVIGNSTRIWELNLHWPLYSQCGVWDVRGRGVDVWECVKDREFRLSLWPFKLLQLISFLDESKPGSQPPNTTYWRYIARR